MLPALLLALREGVEAALIVGILLGVLRKLDRADLNASVWYGVLGAAITSGLVALGLNLAGASLEGPAEPIFEGTALLLAAGLLTWMILWMHRQSRFMKVKLEANVRQALARENVLSEQGAVDQGDQSMRKAGQRALFGVAFLAVVREGIELALFLAAAGLASNPGQEMLGALLGLAAAVGFGWLLFTSTRRLPLSAFFKVTNILLIMFAAGLVSRGAHEFIELGWIPSFIGHIYNFNPILSENSLPGQVLNTLFSYNASPSLTEALAYVLYFAALVLSIFGLQHRIAVKPAQS